MVSSDFGKLDVKRHLISGADCAIAGLVTATVAAPMPALLRKSRRFIHSSQRVDFEGFTVRSWRPDITKGGAVGAQNAPLCATNLRCPPAHAVPGQSSVKIRTRCRSRHFPATQQPP